MKRGFTRERSRLAACATALAVCVAAAGAGSCDKMPLSAPTESTITLYASSTTVGLNASIEVTATVIEKAGTPVQNGTVVTFTTTLGTMDPPEARTNNGKATARLVVGAQSGTAEISAFSGGIAASAALKISVGSAAAGKVELLANPSALPASGGTVQLTAIVNDASGNRLAGVPVSFTTDAGLLSQASVVSDGNGEARTSLSTTGKTRVTASVAGGSTSSLTATIDIPVRVGPTVSITVPASSLVPGVPATFSVTVTAGGAAVRSATLAFGDGAQQTVSTSGSSTATHVYTASGTYTVTAAVTDSAGESATATASVSVQSVIVSVTLTAPSSITTTAPAEFTASATTTPTGPVIERYEWDFGDGSAILVTSSGSTSHVYTAAGQFTVKVRAVTTTGASGTAQRQITVQGTIVSVTLSVPASATVGTPAEFTATATTTPSGLPISRYEWNFGDGSAAVSTSGNSASHAYAAAGTYQVTVRAITTSGAAGEAQRQVVVQGISVSVTLAWSPTSVVKNVPVDFTATASTTPTGVAISRYEWNLGDGRTATTSGNSISHIYTASGTYLVTVRAVTLGGAFGEAQRYVVVP